MRLGAGIATALLGIAAAGCGSDSAAAPTTEPPPPPYVGRVGVPVHAKASNGATADITLNSASWVGSGALVELTMRGTSPQPFKYYDEYVTAGYGGGPQPWTHPDDSNRWGANPAFNYSAINKLPPLGTGSVSSGQTAHGFVAISMGSRTDWYIEVADPDDVGNTEAGWLVHPSPRVRRARCRSALRSATYPERDERD